MPVLLRSAGIKLSRMRYHTEISSKPRPTTTKPITAPLRKAIRNPLFIEARAALAVRADAYVAVFMPRKPDKPLNKPPVRNAKGTHSF